MDSRVFAIMQSAGIPDDVHTKVIDFAKPDKLNGDLKKELELMGTYRTFKNLAMECNREWELYYKAWNARQQPGFVAHGEENDNSNPASMWTYIEWDLVKGDKVCAQHFLKNLAAIRDSDHLLEKVSNYQQVIWEYQGMPSRKYTRKVVTYPALETKKDLISYIDCLQTVIDRAEVMEAQAAHRAMFDSEEEYQWALAEEEEEYLVSLSYDPYDDYY